MPVAVSVLHSLRFLVRSRAALHLEILALRHRMMQMRNQLRRPGVKLALIDVYGGVASGPLRDGEKMLARIPTYYSLTTA